MRYKNGFNETKPLRKSVNFDNNIFFFKKRSFSNKKARIFLIEKVPLPLLDLEFFKGKC